jgi:predicted RNA-binding Zn ribbon-like protein
MPHGLDLAVDFVNTLDLDEGTDALADAAALSAWLASRDLVPAQTLRVGAAELARAIELREALRELMLANNRGESDARAWGTLDEIASAGQLALRFAPDGSVAAGPRSKGFDGVLARILVPVAAAVEDGSWRRAKVCPADDCRWAFYDRSRNRSAVWCDMAVCGNRTKVRAFRGRGAAARER